MTPRRRALAIAACTIGGGLLGLVACSAFPQRYTSSIELWFSGGRTRLGQANRLVVSAIREAYDRRSFPLNGPFPYPSYDFQRIPISCSDRDREAARKATRDLMSATIAAASRLAGLDPEFTSMWLEEAEPPTLTRFAPGEYRWTGWLRLHAPATSSLDRHLLAEQIGGVKRRISSDRFLRALISSLPRYRLELNSDVRAMKRLSVVARRNLHFEIAPQDDVLRISYTCDDPRQAQEVLNRLVVVIGEHTRSATHGSPVYASVGAVSPVPVGVTRTELTPQILQPFEVATPATLPQKADGPRYWLIVVTGLVLGLLFGTMLLSPTRLPSAGRGANYGTTG